MTDAEPTSPRRPSGAAGCLASLEAACRRVPAHVPKVVLVPHAQAGRALAAALARRGVDTAHLVARTPADLAAAAVRRAARRDGLRRLPAPWTAALLDALLADAPDVRDALGGAHPAIARLAADALRDLRLAGVAPGALAAALSRGDGAASARPAALDDLHARFADLLAARRLTDEADLYARALDAPPVLAGAACLVLEDVELTDRALRFVEHAAEGAAARWVLRTDAADAASPRAAAHLLDWPAPEATASSVAEPALHFAEAVGAAAEVRGVLRDVLRRGLPLDAVEVAYAAHDPYLALVCAETDRLGLPRTLAAGVPVRLTRVGQALRGFLGWIEDGCSVPALVRLLAGGLVRVPADLAGDEPLAPHHVATHLTQAGTAAAVASARGRTARLAAYRRTLDALARRREAGGRGGAADAAEAARVRRSAAVVDALAALVPEPSTTLQAVAAAAMAFLRRFGPATLAPETAPAEYTADQHALSLLVQHLLETETLPEARGDAGTLALRLRESAEALFAGARAPRAGRLHVVPLTSAGYAGRPHLYVLGLDAQTAGAPGRLDPLLLDDERARVAEAEGRHLPGADPLEAARAAAPFHLRRVLGELRGVPAEDATPSATLVYNRLDAAEDRPLFPAPAYEDLWAAAGRPLRAAWPLVPASDAGGDAAVVLDAAEAALLARGDGAAARRAALRTLLDGRHTAVRDGRAAQAERAGAALTAFDGCVGPEAAQDVLARTVSPSRLETLVACPYKYFLRYVLQVPVLDPAPEEEDDLAGPVDALVQGSVLHDVFDRYVRGLRDEARPPKPEDAAALHALLDEALDRHVADDASGHAELRSVRRRLAGAVDYFLASEVHHAAEHTPAYTELGLGLHADEAQRPDDHVGPLVLELGSVTLRLKGWVDRVDALPDGTLAVWDYKTGATAPYTPEDLLGDGEKLQWALYAYAVEAALGRPVRRAGYFFTSTRGRGQRFAADPTDVRERLEALLRPALDVAAAGHFPPHPGDACRFCDFALVCGDAQARKAEMKAKRDAAAADDDVPDALAAWCAAR